MNRNAESAECIHGMCEACRYEDCACLCHLLDGPEEQLEDRYDRELDEEGMLNGYY
jgi:hypothetical protein